MLGGAQTQLGGFAPQCPPSFDGWSDREHPCSATAVSAIRAAIDERARPCTPFRVAQYINRSQSNTHTLVSSYCRDVSAKGTQKKAVEPVVEPAASE
jgi:hypothetical protein